MQLPPSLRQAVEQELKVWGSNCDRAGLRAASARLSQCYREAAPGAVAPVVQANSTPSNAALSNTALSNDAQRAAYLAVRLPATYAAAVAALSWARESCSGEIRTVLDLGSGPGTALWAATAVFPTLDAATALERDPRLIEIARRLALRADHSALREATWLQGDLTAAIPEGAWDLVVCSYTLNELREPQRAEFIRQAWARTRSLLVVIEPGTKLGFANVLAARTRLLAAGAGLAAPCPNSLACPMARGGDWCHFAARVERTAEHRRLKDATLGHEDEKFSYVAFARAEVQSPHARIVRHPRIFSGYTQLTLCREGEIRNTTVTRSKKEDWRRLKRLGWGDGW
jgi:ribosomal protein RSM22 (predicted rRNA methylase)